ncbi:hypothetical protein NIIDMKKI_43670 [Mycobacterium kansasii]|uniref:PucR C-terminal helix-turn-helix domain protein n=1 Tax=Mycobacterium kansasii TaxID=1768 RepID=A0A7G1IDN0_MYCKA|nr:hypothetical protein NIIDMKKI_43670 [Mycobacterium kansasii]
MITLDRLVNVLGGYGVRLRWSSLPRSTELRSVVIHEAAATRPLVGDVLLAIGASSVREAVQWAASARAVVVLMRDGERPITSQGDLEAGAVMVLDESLSWSEVAAVVYGLVLEGRETESGRGPTDLFALADSLAEATGGAVTIEDRLLRVLAYSRLQQGADPARVATILGRQTPEQLRVLLDEHGVSAHLATSEDPLYVAADGEHGLTGRMVVAVRSGREVLGSVWVACSAPLSGAERTALTDGAHTVALHLLRSRASADLERQVESELVIQLLEGTIDAATVASRLGLPRGALRVIALRAFVGADRDAALLLAFERATTGFGWSRPGRSALAGNTVYTVLPGDQTAAARRWVSGVRAALPEGCGCGPASADRPRWPTSSRRVRRPTSVWRCTSCARTAPPHRHTTSPGMTSCCNGCAPRPGPAGCQTVGRWPSCAATTEPTPPSTCPRCGPGWRSRATRRGPVSVWGAREHRALPAAEDGRDHHLVSGRRQEAVGHDDRAGGH